MPAYLVQASYTAEAWAAQVKNPQNRLASVGKMIEGAGGKMVAAYYTFGPSDVIVIADMPDNTAMAGFSIAVAASGAVKIQTTPLMTPEEGQQALRAAGTSTYRAPA